VYWRVRKAHC